MHGFEVSVNIDLPRYLGWTISGKFSHFVQEILEHNRVIV